MIIMRKYPKHYRIPHEAITVAYGKRYLDKKQLKNFLKLKDFVLLEKLDGSQFSFTLKNEIPYLQGKNSHIPQGDKRKAYEGVWGWAWQNLEKIRNGSDYQFFGEWMKTQHNLPYDQLPDWVVIFDIYDKTKKKWLDTIKALEVAEDLGFSTTPILYEGQLKYDDLLPLIHQKKSHFCSTHILSETRFSVEEQNQILHPHVRGIPQNRFPDGTIYMEGGIFKSRQNLKFDEVKGNTYWQNAAKLVTKEFLAEFSDDSHWTSSRARFNRLADWTEFEVET